MERSRKEELLDLYEAGDESVYEEAEKLYKEALEKEPESPILLFEYGILQEFKGISLLRKAADCYEKGLNSDSDPSYYRHPSVKEKINWQLINVRARLLENSKSVDLYKQQITEKPTDLQGYCYLISAYLKADQIQEAYKVLEAGLKISSRHRWLQYYAGDIYSRLGDSEKAITHWQKALELDPNLVDVHYSLAFLFLKENRLEEAAEEWRAIIRFLQEDGVDDAFMVWPKNELAAIEEKLKAK